MKRGFTLLELIVVIIIIGILATLGFSQYSRMIERSRGAEGRSVLGAIRTQAAGLWLEKSSGSPPTVPGGTFTPDAVGIGTLVGQIASACNAAAPSTGYYFSYAIAQTAGTGFVGTATRCTALNGKQPGGPAALTLTLTSDFAAGTDSWGGTGGY
jgi:type IV pilus assembly protein PilE